MKELGSLPVCLILLMKVIVFHRTVESLRINIVLDGAVYKEGIQGDMCSLVEAADNAIQKSTLPFNSISSNPEHWTLYVKDTQLVTSECENNNEVLQGLNMSEDDNVYLFRNYLAYEDPLYAADYIKKFSKSFGNRIRPVGEGTTHKKKRKSKTKSKTKTVKNTENLDENDLLVQSVGAIARSFLLGNLPNAFGLDTIDQNNSTEDVNDAKEDSKSKDPKKQSQIDVLTGLINTFGKPMLDSYMKASGEAYKEDL